MAGHILPRGPAAERGRLVTPPRRLLDRLQPFDFADRKLGVRRADVAAFLAVADLHEAIILLRSTNPASLPYIGQRGYTAKPVDCKAKTAKRDDIVDGCIVECAGLVADPQRLSEKVFAGAHKIREYWDETLRGLHPEKVKPGVEVYRRGRGKGFYAVDIGRPSVENRHHGCLMLSQQDVPPDFDPRQEHTRRWMKLHMGYVHGDYDLYGIIDRKALEGTQGVHRQTVFEEELHGQLNLFTGRWREVCDALNLAIGCDMVHHGEQVALRHEASDLYVFAPGDGKWFVSEQVSPREMKGMLFDLFHYVFRTDVASRKP